MLERPQRLVLSALALFGVSTPTLRPTQSLSFTLTCTLSTLLRSIYSDPKSFLNKSLKIHFFLPTKKKA